MPGYIIRQENKNCLKKRGKKKNNPVLQQDEKEAHWQSNKNTADTCMTEWVQKGFMEGHLEGQTHQPNTQKRKTLKKKTEGGRDGTHL